MKKHLLLLTALSFGLFACTDETLSSEENADNNIAQEEQTPSSNLQTAKLAVFSGNQNRVIYAAGTRADEELKPGELKLVATITNPSKNEGFNFTAEEGGRYMSATSVYYDNTNEKYYITYHMQGNNYNTSLKNDIAGAIQVFDIKNGTVTLGDGFRAENPDKEDYDFNHIYFDKIDSRIIVVGHDWKVPSSWESNDPYTGKKDNTTAIIGVFDPTKGTLNYKSIKTAEKAYNEDGHSLGYKDAGDANCVVRVWEYNEYYVATRKGLAVLHADAEKLFQPTLNEDGSNYFVPTPGSCKFIFDTPRVGSMMDVLYLSDERDEEKDLAYSTSSKAKIAQFQTTGGKAGSYVLMNPSSFVTYYDSKDLDIVNYPKQIELPEEIKPIDGKNAFCVNEDYEYYVPLGTNGMYYKFKGAVNSDKVYEGVLKFGNRPVNCVTMDQAKLENGHDGFIYVANGAKLTVLHRRTMEVIANYNIPFLDNDGNEVASSANYIHVEKGPANESTYEPRERIITVAFGQAGVRIFRFMPETKTVWEKDINNMIN